MARSNAAKKDDDDDWAPQQRVVKASSSTPPATGAAASVFDLVKTPKRVHAPIDVAAIVIHKNRPKPAPMRSTGTAFAELYARMAVGDSVDLTHTQANSFYAWSKKQAEATPRGKTKPALSKRKISATTTCVWRDA